MPCAHKSGLETLEVKVCGDGSTEELTAMTSAITFGSLILDKGQYRSLVKAMTMVAWMMKRIIGSDGLKTDGFMPSKMPPWEGALSPAGVGVGTTEVAADAIVDAIVDMMAEVR